MAYATARELDPELIPVVDVSPLRDGSDPEGVAKALHAASQGLGFIYISGHGISDAVLSGARQAALRFFAQPVAQKEEVRVSAAHRGWLGSGGAKMDDDAKSDLKESFIWGYQDANGATPKDHPLRGANNWPGFMPELETHAMGYFEQAHDLAHLLMRGFAIGLGLEEDFFLRSADAPLSRASFVYYPQQPENAGADQFGVGPHTDFGVLIALDQWRLQIDAASGGEYLGARAVVIGAGL